MVLLLSLVKPEASRQGRKEIRYKVVPYNEHIVLVVESTADAAAPSSAEVSAALQRWVCPLRPRLFVTPLYAMLECGQESKETAWTSFLAGVADCVGRRENVTIIHRGVQSAECVEPLVLGILQATKASAEYAMQLVADEIAKEKQMQRLLQLENEEQQDAPQPAGGAAAEETPSDGLTRADTLTPRERRAANEPSRALPLSRRLKAQLAALQGDHARPTLAAPPAQAGRLRARFTLLSDRHGEELLPPCAQGSCLVPQAFLLNPPARHGAMGAHMSINGSLRDRNTRRNSYIYAQRRRRSTMTLISELQQTTLATAAGGTSELKSNGWGGTVHLYEFNGTTSVMALPGVPHFEEVVKNFAVDFWFRTDLRPDEGGRVLLQIMDGQREDVGQLFQLGLNWYKEMAESLRLFIRDSTNRVLEALIPLPTAAAAEAKTTTAAASSSAAAAVGARRAASHPRGAPATGNDRDEDGPDAEESGGGALAGRKGGRRSDKEDWCSGLSFHHVILSVHNLEEGKLSCVLDGRDAEIQLLQHEHPIAFNAWPHRLFLGGYLDESNSPALVFRGALLELRFWAEVEETSGNSNSNGSHGGGGLVPVVRWPLQVEQDGGQLRECTGCIPRDHHETLLELRQAAEPAPACCPYFDGRLVANLGTMPLWGELLHNWRLEIRFRTSVTTRMMSLVGVTDQKLKMQSFGVVLNAEPVFSKERFRFHELNTTFYVVDAFGACCSALLRGNERQSLMDGEWHTLVWKCVDSETNSFSVKIDNVVQDLLFVVREGPTRFVEWSNWVCLGGHNVRNWKLQRLFTGYISRCYVTLRGCHYQTLNLKEGPGAYVLQDSSGHYLHGLLLSSETQAVRRHDVLWVPSQERSAEEEAMANAQGNAGDVRIYKNNRVMLAALLFTCDVVPETRRAEEVMVDVLPPPGDGEEGRRRVYSAAQLLAEPTQDALQGSSRAPWHDAWRAIPDACYRPVDNLTQLEEAINAALGVVRAGRTRAGHFMLVLRIGDCHVTLLQLYEPMAQPQLQPEAHYDRNMLRWHTPFVLQGRHGRRELVLGQMLEAAEAVLGRVGMQPFTVARLGPTNAATLTPANDDAERDAAPDRAAGDEDDEEEKDGRKKKKAPAHTPAAEDKDDDDDAAVGPHREEEEKEKEKEGVVTAGNLLQPDELERQLRRQGRPWMLAALLHSHLLNADYGSALHIVQHALPEMSLDEAAATTLLNKRLHDLAASAAAIVVQRNWRLRLGRREAGRRILAQQLRDRKLEEVRSFRATATPAAKSQLRALLIELCHPHSPAVAALQCDLGELEVALQKQGYVVERKADVGLEAVLHLLRGLDPAASHFVHIVGYGGALQLRQPPVTALELLACSTTEAVERVRLESALQAAYDALQAQMLDELRELKRAKTARRKKKAAKPAAAAGGGAREKKVSPEELELYKRQQQAVLRAAIADCEEDEAAARAELEQDCDAAVELMEHVLHHTRAVTADYVAHFVRPALSLTAPTAPPAPRAPPHEGAEDTKREGAELLSAQDKAAYWRRRYFVYPVQCDRVEPYASTVVTVEQLLRTALRRGVATTQSAATTTTTTIEDGEAERGAREEGGSDRAEGGTVSPPGFQCIVSIDLQPVLPYTRGLACLASSTGHTLYMPYEPQQRLVLSWVMRKAFEGHVRQIPATAKYAVLSGGIVTSAEARDWRSFANYVVRKMRVTCANGAAHEALKAELARELPFTTELIPLRAVNVSEEQKERLRRDRESQKVTAKLTFGIGSTRVQNDMFALFKNVVEGLPLTEIAFTNTLHLFLGQHNHKIDGVVHAAVRAAMEQCRPVGCKVTFAVQTSAQGVRVSFTLPEPSDRLSLTQWLAVVVVRSLTWSLPVCPLEGGGSVEVIGVEYVYTVKTMCHVRRYRQLLKQLYMRPLSEADIRFLDCELVKGK